MPPQRFSDQSPEGSRPDDPERWRAYDGDEAARDAAKWSDADADPDMDPFDRRALPRRRRPRSSRVARVLAWTGGAALLMAAGGVLALAVWPRAPVPVPPVAAPPTDPVIATAPAATASPGSDAPAAPDRRAPATSPEPDRDAPEPRSATQPDRDGSIVPPPLPPLPPGLERATPPPAAEAAVPVEPQPPAQLPAYGPREHRAAVPPPAPPPAQDSRSSEEIMADFLVSTGDRGQAENTARSYAEWYPAGSAERKYWLAVFQAIRSRP